MAIGVDILNKEDLILLILVYTFFINLYSFILFRKDKVLSKKNAWRVSEAKLLIVSMLGGSLGSLIAMNKYSHKTKKAQFQIGLPIILVFNFVFLYYVYIYFLA